MYADTKIVNACALRHALPDPMLRCNPLRSTHCLSTQPQKYKHTAQIDALSPLLRPIFRATRTQTAHTLIKSAPSPLPKLLPPRYAASPRFSLP